MTAATLIDPVVRYRILHDAGLRPGQLASVREYIRAGQRAKEQGFAQAFWSVLSDKERLHILQFKDRPDVTTPWFYVHGIATVTYRQATAKPIVHRLPRPEVLLLPAPRIAGLLPAVCPTPEQPALDYWQALEILEHAGQRTRET